MTYVNERGQIIGDDGISWNAGKRGFWSYSPRGYFIERLPPSETGGDLMMQRMGVEVDKRWTLFRQQPGALGSTVRQPLYRGRVRQCMRVAEIYEIRRVIM